MGATDAFRAPGFCGAVLLACLLVVGLAGPAPGQGHTEPGLMATPDDCASPARTAGRPGPKPVRTDSWPLFTTVTALTRAEHPGDAARPLPGKELQSLLGKTVSLDDPEGVTWLPAYRAGWREGSQLLLVLRQGPDGDHWFAQLLQEGKASGDPLPLAEHRTRPPPRPGPAALLRSEIHLSSMDRIYVTELRAASTDVAERAPRLHTRVVGADACGGLEYVEAGDHDDRETLLYILYGRIHHAVQGLMAEAPNEPAEAVIMAILADAAWASEHDPTPGDVLPYLMPVLQAWPEAVRAALPGFGEALQALLRPALDAPQAGPS